jgi:hypothetical protein
MRGSRWTRRVQGQTAWIESGAAWLVAPDSGSCFCGACLPLGAQAAAVECWRACVLAAPIRRNSTMLAINVQRSESTRFGPRLCCGGSVDGVDRHRERCHACAEAEPAWQHARAECERDQGCERDRRIADVEGN